MKETILKDINWMEDWGGYSTVINELNEHISSETLKVFIQKADSSAWIQVPLIPDVSADGYAYSWANGLQIFYLGNQAPDKLLIKIDH
ncbi:hypothetical protein [Lacibacter sediminis]|uniref:Uncharacterized protein n=1 Tax=Lacibacter sediminis TaxID=2760713 RepID=A0A7G5XIW7_9BACT|nr:hypothetical protein [Lacibacter sediminis]QNA45420.1 hypothetical protein H4075_04250 [Lacibacter sediminis]